MGVLESLREGKKNIFCHPLNREARENDFSMHAWFISHILSGTIFLKSQYLRTQKKTLECNQFECRCPVKSTIEKCCCHVADVIPDTHMCLH